MTSPLHTAFAIVSATSFTTLTQQTNTRSLPTIKDGEGIGVIYPRGVRARNKGILIILFSGRSSCLEANKRWGLYFLSFVFLLFLVMINLEKEEETVGVRGSRQSRSSFLHFLKPQRNTLLFPTRSLLSNRKSSRQSRIYNAISIINHYARKLFINEKVFLKKPSSPPPWVDFQEKASSRALLTRLCGRRRRHRRPPRISCSTSYPP